MRKFLLILSFCLMPFGANAYGILDLPELALTQITSAIARNSGSVDEMLRSYADADDYQAILDAGAGFYYTSIFNPYNKTGYSAAYNPKEHDIQINVNYLGETKALLQGMIHHEVQHLKDFVILKENGYDTENLIGNLDKTSQMLFGGILEARAYTEQTVYFYNKKENLFKEMEKLKKASEEIKQKGLPASVTIEYQYLKSVMNDALDLLGEDPENVTSVTAKNIDVLYKQVKKEYEMFEKEYDDMVNADKKRVGIIAKALANPSAKVFDEAIKEGKSIDEAKRIAAKSLLNSGFFSFAYISVYENWESGDSHISPEKLFEHFGGDIFTIDDFYEVEDFWQKVCNRKETTGSAECGSFWNRYEAKNCPDLREKWRDCARLYEVAVAENKCRISRKKRILVQEKDKKNYEKCCSFIDTDYSPFYGKTKEESKMTEEELKKEYTRPNPFLFF